MKKQQTRILSHKPIRTVEGISRDAGGCKNALAIVKFSDWYEDFSKSFFPEYFWHKGFVIVTYTEYNDGYTDGKITKGIFLSEEDCKKSFKVFKADFIKESRKLSKRKNPVKKLKRA